MLTAPGIGRIVACKKEKTIKTIGPNAPYDEIISCNFSWLIFSNPKIFAIKIKINN